MKYILLALSLCLALLAVAADKNAKPALKAKPRFELKLGGSLLKSVPFPARTVKLAFTLKGEDEAETFIVLSSGGEYTISHEHSGPDFEHSLQFNGEVTPGADATKVAFTYSVMTMHENQNEGERGAFTLKGSAVLKAGKETLLGHLGGQVVVVTATINE